MYKKLFLGLFFLAFSSFVLAEMSSTHYFIGKDSINSFGDENSTSSNYILSDTGGEIATGYEGSSSYTLHGGFRQVEEYKMELDCSDKNANLTPVRLTGKSSLHRNYIECNIKTNNPTGYTFQWSSASDELVQKVDPSHKIEKITNTAPSDWPAVLTNGTGWGGHLGIESDNYDALKWGATNDYDSGGGQWAALSEDEEFEIITRDSPTSATGDNQVIYFGLEVDENTVVPPGEYQTEIELTLLPVF